MSWIWEGLGIAFVWILMDLHVLSRPTTYALIPWVVFAAALTENKPPRHRWLSGVVTCASLSVALWVAVWAIVKYWPF